MSSNPLVNGPVWAFTYFFRGTPLLVQMFLFYYGLGQLQFMIELSQSFEFLKSAYWYALIAFTLNTCAYTTEIIRGAIAGTPYGEIEAADRKRVVSGKNVSVRVELGGGRSNQKKNDRHEH